VGEPAAPEKRPRRARALRALALLACAAYVGASVLVWSAPRFWLGELAASFAWHLGLAGLAGAALAWLVSARGVATLTFVLGFVHVWPELSLSLPTRSRPAAEGAPMSETGLVLASCNLLHDNEEHEAFLRWVAEEDPDVLLCYELSGAWRAALEELRAEYPHVLWSPAPESWTPDTWCTAVFSRVPLERTRLIELPSAGQRPPMEAVLRLGGRELLLRGAHPMRAGRAWRLALRDEALDTLGAEPWPEASVLAGDLNVTSSSPVFARLVGASGLSDSRRGFGRQPSFTVRTGLLDLPIAIDHVLVGRGVQVLERRAVALPGSDHHAVVARLALAAR
jgi:endonuclease/exonuclease/phosphatase (EEP) superfamily protein YafD